MARDLGRTRRKTKVLPRFAQSLDKIRIQDAGAFGKIGTIKVGTMMLADWKDRIEGIKRIVLALSVMSLCAIASQYDKVQLAGALPEKLRTENAQLANCSAQELQTKIGRFGCAVVLEPKQNKPTVQFLSAETKSGIAGGNGLPLLKQP